MSNQNKKTLSEITLEFAAKENLEILKIEIAELLEKPLKKRELNAIEEKRLAELEAIFGS